MDGLRGGTPPKAYAALDSSEISCLRAGSPVRAYTPLSSPRPPLPPPSADGAGRPRSTSPSDDLPWEEQRTSRSSSPARDDLARDDKAVRQLAESLGNNIRHQAQLLASIGHQHSPHAVQPERNHSHSGSSPVTPDRRNVLHAQGDQRAQQQTQPTFTEKIREVYRSASPAGTGPAWRHEGAEYGRQPEHLDAAVAREMSVLTPSGPTTSSPMSVLSPADYQSTVGQQIAADYRSEAADLTTAAAAAAMKMYMQPEPVQSAGQSELLLELQEALQEARDMLMQQKREFDLRSKLLIGSLAAELDAVKEDLAAELQQERQDRQVIGVTGVTWACASLQCRWRCWVRCLGARGQLFVGFSVAPVHSFSPCSCCRTE